MSSPNAEAPIGALAASAGADGALAGSTFAAVAVLSGVAAGIHLGVAPEHCVFVDDLGGNLKPAKALGMATIRHTSAALTIPAMERLLSSSNPS